MLELWHIISIIGIILEIIGFISMLRQVSGGITKLIENNWDVFIKVWRTMIGKDFDQIDQKDLKKIVVEELPKSFELRGIILVVAGLCIQIISIAIEASLGT